MGPFTDRFPSLKPPFILGNFYGYVSHNKMDSDGKILGDIMEI